MGRERIASDEVAPEILLVPTEQEGPLDAFGLPQCPDQGDQIGLANEGGPTEGADRCRLQVGPGRDSADQE